MKVLFPLITIPYLSRVLMADGLGKVNYAVNIVTWFLLFASLGIPRYGVREIAKHRESKLNTDTVFSEIFTINLIGTILCIAVYFIIIFNVPSFKNKLLLYIVVGIQLGLNIFNVDWFYQGIEEYAYITKRSLFIKVLSLIAMFTFVRSHNDYIIYAFIQSMAVAGNYIFNFFHLRMYVRIRTKNLVLKKHLLAVSILFSTQLAVNIYALLDTTMLGLMCTDSIVGYYSNVHKVISTVCVLTASLGGVMLPRFVHLISSKNYNELSKLMVKAQDVIIAMCLPISVGIFLVAEDTVLILFGNDFMDAVTTLKIFAPFIVLSTVGNLYGTQLLMAFNKEKTLLFSVMVGAVLNLSMNYFLIKNYQHNGAALASVITEFAVMIVQIAVVKRIFKINFHVVLWIKSGLSLLSMAIVILVLQKLLDNVLLRLVLTIVFGGMTYLATSIILKNEGINTVIHSFCTSSIFIYFLPFFRFVRNRSQ